MTKLFSNINIIYNKGLDFISLHRKIWIIIFLFSVLSVIDIPLYDVLNLNIFVIVSFLFFIGFLKSVIFLCLYFVFNRFKFTKIVFWILLFFFFLFSIINSLSFFLYGFGISRKLVIILLQSNVSEILQFLPGLFNNLIDSNLIIVLLVVSIVLFVIRYVPDKIIRSVINICMPLSIIFFVAWSFYFDIGRKNIFMSIRVPLFVYEAIRSQNALEEQIIKKRTLPDPQTVFSSHKAANIVMVLGESASRAHHSIYGYPITTTPNLYTLRDSLFIFDDVIGTAANTADNMERILSFKKDTDSDEWYHYPLLVDLFRKAGYKFFWLSNQERSGFWSNSSGAMASSADVIKYVGNEVSEDILLLKYDEVLLSEMYSALSDTAKYKFITLHLLGSHCDYKMRYPKSRALFDAQNIMAFNKNKWVTDTKAQIIAEYDNSILYTDSILNEIIKTASVQQTPTIVLYFSDHGENVYDNRDFIGRDINFIDVPFIIYVNREYANLNPNDCNRLERALYYPITTANIIYALMTLTGTKYDKYYDAKNDFLSDDFVIRQRWADDRPIK